MASYLENSVKFVAGVGEARAKLLEKELGIITIGDLLRHYPFRYIDRTKIYPIAAINEQHNSTMVQIRGRVTGVAYSGTGRKQRFSAFVSDATGTAEMLWFNGIKWIEKSIEVGKEYIIFGKPSIFRGEISMVHPEMESVEKAASRSVQSGMQGIYPSTEKISSSLSNKGIYTIVSNAWAKAAEHIVETMPQTLLKKHNLISLREALHNIHFPQSEAMLAAAKRRLKFDELLGVQLAIQARRTDRMERQTGFMMPRVGENFNSFYNERLPFPLTGAQKRVIKEIRQDMVSHHQMNRLRQGDVGSG